MTLELKEPRTSVISHGRKKVTSHFLDGREMLEEFDVITDELLLRKTRKPSAIGGEGVWILEVGVDNSNSNNSSKPFDSYRDVMSVASDQPCLSMQQDGDKFVFRVRNLPYPKECYSVVLEWCDNQTKKEIVIRTSNKKYFKRISIPDMDRTNLKLEEENLSWVWKNQTLIVEYKKPLAIKTLEAQWKKERSAMPSTRVKDGNEASQCQHQ